MVLLLPPQLRPVRDFSTGLPLQDGNPVKNPLTLKFLQSFQWRLHHQRKPHDRTRHPHVAATDAHSRPHPPAHPGAGAGTRLAGPARERTHRRPLRLRARRDRLWLQPGRRPARLARADRRHRPVQHQGLAVHGAPARLRHPLPAARFHHRQALQKGAITGLAYRLAPRSIVHSWVEVWSGGR